MGKVVTLNEDGSFATTKTANTVVEKITTGITSMFGGENQAVTSDIMLWTTAATNVANTVATSLVTRKRAEEGKEAVLKVLF